MLRSELIILNQKGEVFFIYTCLSICFQLNKEMPKTFKFPQSSEWWTILQHKMDINKQAVAQSINNHSIPMNFYCAFNVVSVIILYLDRHRLCTYTTHLELAIGL